MVEGISSGSAAQMQQMQKMRQEMFAKLDSNGDSKLDQTEMADGLKNNQPPQEAAEGAETGEAPDPAEMMSKIFEETDSNGDGTIDEEEFLSAKPPEGPGRKIDVRA